MRLRSYLYADRRFGRPIKRGRHSIIGRFFLLLPIKFLSFRFYYRPLNFLHSPLSFLFFSLLLLFFSGNESLSPLSLQLIEVLERLLEQRRNNCELRTLLRGLSQQAVNELFYRDGEFGAQMTNGRRRRRQL